MLINLPARACTLCGRTDQLVRDGSRTMGPHAKWNTRLNLGAGARLNGGERCSRASFDRLVHGGGQGGVTL